MFGLSSVNNVSVVATCLLNYNMNVLLGLFSVGDFINSTLKKLLSKILEELWVS